VKVIETPGKLIARRVSRDVKYIWENENEGRNVCLGHHRYAYRKSNKIDEQNFPLYISHFDDIQSLNFFKIFPTGTVFFFSSKPNLRENLLKQGRHATNDKSIICSNGGVGCGDGGGSGVVVVVVVRWWW